MSDGPVLWIQPDTNDSRRQLFVERPDEHGHVGVGITHAYRKFLTPGEAREMAAALLAAAGEAEAAAPIVVRVSYPAETTVTYELIKPEG